MSESPTDDYAFECSDCGEEFEVNSGMREALLTHGCPVCGASVCDEEFTSIAQS
ncbi:zinc ribbon domain-containing protein [Halalkaliarchaeum sp. AArc-GB]|uniref:zinc ribbon domain-containing protein n=1 Tax=unclassified Halalkaliarchaeum TaxID=2678344 RepID=UPI00217D5294|nr:MULTISPECIES: zinc ribbon domain-containing protein [unclassified Halalkaliarchaeum]MDR5674671.1 zinc ribbon domain-containing protein [Halalkaliarchaeum sp. AArc-GB]